MRLCNFAFLGIFLISTAVPVVLAQSTKVEVPLPDAPVSNSPERPVSRADIFAGYSFLTVHGEVFGFKFSETHNAPIVGLSYYLTKNFGLEGQFTFSSSDSTTCFSSAQGGPVVRFFAGSQLSIFAHADIGETKMGIRYLQDCAWKPSVAAGGGMDYIFSGAGHHVGFRVIQADYQYVRLNYDFLDATGTTSVNVPRLSTGLTFRLGEIEPPGVKVAKSFECRTNPADGYAGERVVLAALATGYDFSKPYSIHWTSTGGTVVYPGPDVLLETTGLAPGSYVATAHLTHGKELHSDRDLHCTFPVEASAEPDGSVLCRSCVDPGRGRNDDHSSWNERRKSQAGLQLYHQCRADSRQRIDSAAAVGRRGDDNRYVPGEGRSGADGGSIDGSEREDGGARGSSSPCNASSGKDWPTSSGSGTDAAPPTVEAPPLPAWAAGSETTKILKGCSLSFENKEGRKMQLDAASTTCLDEIAVTMQQRPGTRLTLVGNHPPSEANGAGLAAERATVSKTFLEEQQRGIDASRIDVRTGSSTTRLVETFILTPGVVFDPPPTEQQKEN